MARLFQKTWSGRFIRKVVRWSMKNLSNAYRELWLPQSQHTHEPPDDGARFVQSQRGGESKIEKPVRRQHERSQHYGVKRAERELDGPRRSGARARRHPERRDVSEGKTRPP